MSCRAAGVAGPARAASSSSAASLLGSRNVVSTQWVEDHLGSITLLDGTIYHSGHGEAEHAACHIPGSVWFDIDGIADTSSPLPHMLPSDEVFASAVARLGITKSKPVVVYDRQGLFSAARVWWMLKGFGHPSVAVMDGGLPNWRGPIDSGSVDYEDKAVPVETWTLDRARMVRSLEDIVANIKSRKELVVDARAAPRFTGADDEPRPGIPSGHIPGSRNVPFGALLDAKRNGVMLPKTRLTETFKKAGVDVASSQQLVVSCGSGLTAAIVALAMVELGRPFDAISLYDGSWVEYGSHPDTVKAKGDGRGE